MQMTSSAFWARSCPVDDLLPWLRLPIFTFSLPSCDVKSSLQRQHRVKVKHKFYLTTTTTRNCPFVLHSGGMKMSLWVVLLRVRQNGSVPVTEVCQRLTPPKADIRYMIMMANCTSVTSTLRRHSRQALIQVFSQTSRALLVGNWRAFRISRCAYSPKRSVPDTYVCQWAQKNMNVPINPQNQIQFGYFPIPHEMHVPTETKTEK